MTKQKQPKNNHVIIVTSDNADAEVRKYRIQPWMVQTAVLVLCVVIGALIGYFIYEGKLWEMADKKSQGLEDTITQVEQEKETLLGQIDGLNQEIGDLNEQIENLNAKLTILSETVNQKTEIEKELTAQIEQQSTPTEYPLTGSASMEEGKEGNAICIFTASEGATVVATAAGTVTAINEDVEYGRNVWVDHGNGYITIYRNQGNPNVKLGDEVAPGTTLFVIGKDNKKFGYQIMKDEAYINPMDMLSISG